MQFNVAAFDLKAIAAAARQVAAIGKTMPHEIDQDEARTSAWVISLEPHLEKVERLLNPTRLPFGDKRRKFFFGDGSIATTLLGLRNDLDGILVALDAQSLSEKERYCARGNHVRGERAGFPWPHQFIGWEEWQRIADAAELLEGSEEAASNRGPQDNDPGLLLSVSGLAARLGIREDDAKTRDALRKRVEAWRGKSPDGGWIEVQDPKPNEPRYLYPLGKVWPFIKGMKNSGKSPADLRPK